MILRVVDGLVQLFDCTIFNKFVSNSSVTVFSHAPGQYERYILSGKSIQMSILDNGLVLAWYPFTGFFGIAGHVDSSVINVLNYHCYL